jgi:hypothetical protein
MAASGSWTPGKIFLVVLLALAGLGLLCCGGVWFVAGDKIMGGIRFGVDSNKFVEALREEFGETASFALVNNDQNQFTLAVGVPGELTPERVTEAQDEAWRIAADVFAENGFFPVSHVAIGEPTTSGDANSPPVNWMQNSVTVEELVRRTGVARPKIVPFLPENLGENAKVVVKSGDETEPEGDGEPDGK